MNQSTINDDARSAAKPADQLLESLSALMDDEASPLEIRRLVKSLPDNPELADSWRRYHAVRASVLRETHVTPSIDLLPGIKARLHEQQGTGIKPSRTGGVSSQLVRFLGQGAIAASVAGAVLLGYPLLQGTDSSTGSAALVAGQNAASTLDNTPVLNGNFTASPLTRTVSLDAASRDRLQQAVYEFSGTSAVLDADAPMFPSQLVPFEPETEQASE